MTMVSSPMHFSKWLVLIVSIISTISDGCAQSVLPLIPHLKLLNLSRNDFDAVPRGKPEYAVVGMTHGLFKGAQVTINVWNPTVPVVPEVSFSQIWIESGTRENLNTVEAGWLVDTVSKETKIFTFWTSAGYKNGCYNLECGFKLISDRYKPGFPIGPVSTYGGPQYDISIAIEKEIFQHQDTGDWWLRIQDVDVGFWPKELFTSLQDHAEAITWGGEIVNTEPDGRHTSTQMGSGHFPSEGFGKASYFRHLKFLDDRFIPRDPENLERRVTKPECYDLLLNVDSPEEVGVNFYYGGPGVSALCAK